MAISFLPLLLYHHLYSAETKSSNIVHLNVVFCRSVAQNELNAADQEKMIGIAILSFISLVTLVFYFFVKNALSVIRVSGKVPVIHFEPLNLI